VDRQQPSPEISERDIFFEQLLKKAAAIFGADAEFSYHNAAKNIVATLTLQDAISICGQHMQGEDDEALFATLERMHILRQRITPQRALLDKSRIVGQHIMSMRQSAQES
jgi:hypothetical protein